MANIYISGMENQSGISIADVYSHFAEEFLDGWTMAGYMTEAIGRRYLPMVRPEAPLNQPGKSSRLRAFAEYGR
jgi:hypothetical protein